MIPLILALSETVVQCALDTLATINDIQQADQLSKGFGKKYGKVRELSNRNGSSLTRELIEKYCMILFMAN